MEPEEEWLQILIRTAVFPIQVAVDGGPQRVHPNSPALTHRHKRGPRHLVQD